MITVLNRQAASGLPRLHRPPPLEPNPLVSVCIPTLNRSSYVEAAVKSAAVQTYERLEIIVVDDHSADDTVQRVQAVDDPRIRVFVNPRTLGQASNRNRALRLARGDLIKFLDSDDLMEARCVEAMLASFHQDPAVGLVFSPRTILLGGPSADASEQWLAKYRNLHAGFGALKPCNDGRELLALWIAAGFRDNWIGEPSAVMVRRAHLEISGGFSQRVRQTMDANLWARIIARSLVGFIDDKLVSYRHGHHPSEANTNLTTWRTWTDRLWNLETLAGDDEIRSAYPEVMDLLRTERRLSWRTAARLGHVPDAASVSVRPYLGYLRFRLESKAGRSRQLFPPIPAWSSAQAGDIGNLTPGELPTPPG